MVLGRLYILCAIEIDLVGSLEAGLKYLIIGGVGSAVLLFGSALVYGATGELGFAQIAEATSRQGLDDDPMLLVGLAMIIAGLAFKASAAPFHMWTPDVYEGAPTPVTGVHGGGDEDRRARRSRTRARDARSRRSEELWTIAVAVIACISLAVGQPRRARPAAT